MASLTKTLEKWNDTLQSLVVVRTLVTWSKRRTFPGFQGVSLYQVIVFLKNEVLYSPMLMTRANAIAFSFFMSLFPAFLVLFSLIPFLPIDKREVMTQIELAVNEIMPNATGDNLTKAIGRFLKNKRSDFLSVGFVLAIFFSSNGLMALMRSFEKSNPLFFKRRHWEKRLRAIAMTLILGLLLVVSSVLVISGNKLFRAIFDVLALNKWTINTLLVLRWVVVILVIYIGIAIIYRFGIATRRKLHFLSPGAAVATVLSLLSSIAFSFYVDNFGNYSKIYDSFVAGIVLLLWLQLNAIILIIGFELNAAIAIHRNLLLAHNEVIAEAEAYEKAIEQDNNPDNLPLESV